MDDANRLLFHWVRKDVLLRSVGESLESTVRTNWEVTEAL